MITLDSFITNPILTHIGDSIMDKDEYVSYLIETGQIPQTDDEIYQLLDDMSQNQPLDNENLNVESVA